MSRWNDAPAPILQDQNVGSLLKFTAWRFLTRAKTLVRAAP